MTLLTDHLPLVAGAPDGIKKLRELILELAVRGRLVPQDPSDEPAGEFLARIPTGGARLMIDAKSLKRLPVEMKPDETLFELPKSWKWVRLGEIAEIVRGVTYNKSDASDLPSPTHVPLLRGNNINSVLNFERPVYVPRKLLKASQYVKKGDIVIAMSSGSADLVGKAAQAEEDFAGGFGAFCGVVRSLSLELIQYFGFFFQTPHYRKRASSHGKGIGINNLQKTVLQTLEVPIPPAAEQIRIVAKVDELMALCDTLEAQQANAESAHAQLVQALLDSLTQASNAEDFATSWQRLSEHFDTLFTTEASIDALKQAVLQLAVMGKLVPQDCSDEPAGELLARLAKDRIHYAGVHNIAVAKPEPISVQDQSISLPRGWAWTRLCSVFRVITDGDHQPPPKSTDGIAFLTIGNVTKMYLDFSNCRFVPQDYFDRVAPYRRPEIGDILYTVVGATYGRPITVNSSREFCVQRHIAILKTSELLSSSFACNLLSSTWVYEQATRSITGTAQPTIPLRPLRNFLVMLPPLAEQHRIAAKVSQLMALCDQLKPRIQQARELNQKLASTLVEQAVA